MTVSGILTCSTCQHKIRLRIQLGYILNFPLKIACGQCGKLIRGTFDHKYIFPDDSFSNEYVETTQTVSMSSELPINLKKTNTNELVALSPFMAMGDLLSLQKLMLFTSKLTPFLDFYKESFRPLVACADIFNSGNYKYFLMAAKKHFRPNLIIGPETFEVSAVVMNDILNDFFQYLSVDSYKTDFSNKLKDNTFEKVKANGVELANIKVVMGDYINVETEFKKAVSLAVQFIENTNAFFPAIALTYNGDFKKEYRDEAGLTTFEFLDLKEIYIEQFEYLSRTSALYFALWNLAERGNLNDFGAIRECVDLAAYCAKNNGIKKEIVKKSPLLNEYFLNTLDSQIRNGIGHLKTVYNPKTQLIKYYPFKDAARRETHKEIYLIDFVLLVYQQALKVRDSIQMWSRLIEMT